MKGEKIGYGRPPKRSQFKPGQSGNPKGRPKGSTNLATDLSSELGELISVKENGRTRRISKQRALVKSFAAKALQGDIRALTALLALQNRITTESNSTAAPIIEAEELEILHRYAPRFLKSKDEQK